MTGVLIKRENLDTEIDMRRRKTMQRDPETAILKPRNP